MKIHFTRDSVCMGDDCFDNSRDYHFKSNSNIESIIPIIKENRFLASVSGGDVVWVLTDFSNKEILSYFTKKDIVIYHVDKNNELSKICSKRRELHFKYYSSPKRRGEYINKLYNGDTNHMQKDGFLEEYKMCIYE